MSAPVSVLHVITRMIVGGAAVNTLLTCKHLDRSRFEVALLTGPELGPEGDLLTPASREPFPITVVPSLRRELRPGSDLVAYRAIRRHLRERRYAVVHTHTSKAGILARRAAANAGVPAIIHTAHGWQWTKARSGPMNRFIVAAERWAARSSDRIVVVAEEDRRKGLEAGVGKPEQYVLIESAIPLEEFDPARRDGRAFRAERGIPLDAPVAGTVGRFAYQKAPEVMLAAAREILDAAPECHFVYVGDGPLREQVLVELGDFRNHPRLHLVGIREDVPDVVAAFDVFLLSSRYEGLPRVVVEAMALGKPVVSTRVDGVREVVLEGKTGVLASPDCAADLAGAALALLSSPERGRGMGAEGRRLVLGRFDLRRMIERIENLYDEVLAEKGAVPAPRAAIPHPGRG